MVEQERPPGIQERGPTGDVNEILRNEDETTPEPAPSPSFTKEEVEEMIRQAGADLQRDFKHQVESQRRHFQRTSDSRVTRAEQTAQQAMQQTDRMRELLMQQLDPEQQQAMRTRLLEEQVRNLSQPVPASNEGTSAPTGTVPEPQVNSALMEQARRIAGRYGVDPAPGGSIDPRLVVGITDDMDVLTAWQTFENNAKRIAGVTPQATPSRVPPAGTTAGNAQPPEPPPQPPPTMTDAAAQSSSYRGWRDVYDAYIRGEISGEEYKRESEKFNIQI